MLSGAIIISSCEQDPPDPTLVKAWSNFTLTTSNESTPRPGRTETGTFTLELYSDNTVKYTAVINNLLAGDALIAGHIHSGDAVTDGPIILNLNPVFVSGTSSGTVAITSTLADSLRNTPVYVNFHSNNFPAGLVRAQLDKTIDVAYTIALSGANEVPPSGSLAVGTAQLRLMTDKTLHYKITVTGLNTLVDGTLTLAHVHRAAVGVNGPTFIDLVVPADATAFGQSKSVVLTDPQIASLKNDQIYVNVHSTTKPGGLIRGQIR